MADNNIIFIGMPAVGKSTVGVVIAKRLGYKFVDTDILIQESEGKLLKDIIADVGPDGFLKGQCTGESGTYRYLAGRQRSIL